MMCSNSLGRTPSHDTSKESFCSDKSKSKKVTKAVVNTQPKKSTAKSNTKPAAQGARTNRKELSPSPLKAKEKAQTNSKNLNCFRIVLSWIYIKLLHRKGPNQAKAITSQLNQIGGRRIADLSPKSKKSKKKSLQKYRL